MEITFLNKFNEMLIYERDMDQLRALALWITQYDGNPPIPSLYNPTNYVFGLIKYYSNVFASEIMENNSIPAHAISRFHSALASINTLLGITQEDIVEAGQMQRYRNSGFWEMRRFIGQFGDVAESVVTDGVNHIIPAAVSGCIVGEYLGLKISEIYNRSVPIDHMVFARRGIEPTSGHLSDDTFLIGNHILLVDDAVMETVTGNVMLETIRAINPSAIISLMAIEISPEAKSSGFLNQFSHVYTFDE